MSNEHQLLNHNQFRPSLQYNLVCKDIVFLKYQSTVLKLKLMLQ
jgi:hypothetical protein